MAGIRISGMASGLPPNIVEQIMEAEKLPIKSMEQKKSAEDNKMKLITDFEGKISEISKSIGDLTGLGGFTAHKITSGDPNIVEGTIDAAKAVNGQWQIEVVQLAQKPGALSNGFPDKDKTQVGVGYLRFNTPDGRKDVYINQGNNTLEGLSKAINSANVGLRASVMNDRNNKDTPFRLMVTGVSSGSDNQVSFPTIYMLDGDQDLYFDESKASQNARIKVDGFEIEVPDNVVTDVIPGLTLDLKQAAPGRSIRMTVKEDVEVIGGKMKSFVEAYNKALSFVQDQAKLQKGPDGKEKLGPLGGDGMIRSVESTLRRIILDPQIGVGGSITRLSELGIEFNRNGTLNFNQEKFNGAVAAKPADAAAFFRGDGGSIGFIPSLKRNIGNITNAGMGPLGNRKRGIQSKIDAIDKQIDSKQRQLEKKEDSLRKKFSDLEATMSKLQGQGSQISAIGGAAR